MRKIYIAAATLLATLTQAQLPRQCFLVTPMHGPDIRDDSEYMSDLPMLTRQFQPDMKLSSVIAIENTVDNSLVGVEMDLKNHSTLLDLKVISAEIETSESRKFDIYEPFEQVKIVTNKRGVCNVVIKQGPEEISLAKNTSKCDSSQDDVEVTSMAISKVAPLVGFHAAVGQTGINQLGLIFYDTISPSCLSGTSLSLSESLLQFSDQDQALYMAKTESQYESENKI